MTDCYYSSYFESPKEIRQAALGTKYHFSCHCQACNSNWPTAQFAPKALVDIPDDQLMFSTDDVRNAKLIFERINKLGTKIALEQKNEDYDKVRWEFAKFYGLEKKPRLTPTRKRIKYVVDRFLRTGSIHPVP